MTNTEFRAILKYLDLSQRSLAERLGVAVSTVNRWALGRIPVPQYAAAYLVLLGDCRMAVQQLELLTQVSVVTVPAII